MDIDATEDFAMETQTDDSIAPPSAEAQPSVIPPAPRSLYTGPTTSQTNIQHPSVSHPSIHVHDADANTPIYHADDHVQLPEVLATPGAQSLLPGSSSGPALRSTRSARKRRPARVRAAPIDYEEDAPDDPLPLPRTAQPRTAEDPLGLYDDSDGGEDVHHNLLLHTQTENDDSSSRPIPANTLSDNNILVELPTPAEYPMSADPNTTYMAAHDSWLVRLVILLVAFLHAAHHVSFRACRIILQCSRAILLAMDAYDPTPRPGRPTFPVTLGTVIVRLDLEDHFKILPTCSNCQRLFPSSAPISTKCPDCQEPIYKPVSNSIFRRVTGCAAKPPPPVSASPFQLPSSLLADFLARPGMEKQCEIWKTCQRTPGVLHDITDGRVWNEAEGPDQKPFFPLNGEEGSELRIGITVSLDWCSVERHLYRAENLLVSFMTPGPQEPTAEELQHYLKLVVDDLEQLFNNGVVYHTPCTPEGKSSV
ncbi:hypothetical protein CONPUDRAFT_159022 [Coniophora puteana RWD-64-598 SS2]|uniref:Uncharacterized protein n=1 Tax=Coniophora puteana (strain RWD-64-598) TaxID=741705 RepID=A0A5M3M8P7_CONPW|nr:uncharacterized protein CONPUDRAFT_159022 [Coniophora puteana RWD-64-598 SS2]EIW75569.1 hypothetical protein CONPUDRAFT_159022 [Coniophora puteana RWD-64-598 SS2]